VEANGPGPVRSNRANRKSSAAWRTNASKRINLLFWEKSADDNDTRQRRGGGERRKKRIVTVSAGMRRRQRRRRRRSTTRPTTTAYYGANILPLLIRKNYGKIVDTTTRLRMSRKWTPACCSRVHPNGWGRRERAIVKNRTYLRSLGAVRYTR